MTCLFGALRQPQSRQPQRAGTPRFAGYPWDHWTIMWITVNKRCMTVPSHWFARRFVPLLNFQAVGAPSRLVIPAHAGQSCG